MKIIAFASIALCFAATIASGQSGANCIVPPNLQAAYEADVRDLAVRRMYEVHHPDTARIAIPTIHTDSIWRGLAAIFNSSAQAVDSVFAKHCIHNSGAGGYRTSRLGVFVRVDTNYAWTHAWRNGSTVTGYAALDSFMARYGFTVVGFHSFPWGTNGADLKPNAGVNCFTFADSIRQFAGVLSYEIDWGAGDGDYIKYRRDTVARYTFRIGLGDCPAGCTAQLLWTYRVDASCNVVLDSIRHSPGVTAPPAINCGLNPPNLNASSPLPDEDFSLHPNPATGTIQLRFRRASNERGRFCIQDITGRVVAAGGMPADGILGVSTLPAGMYLFMASRGGEAMSAMRFVKQ